MLNLKTFISPLLPHMILGQKYPENRFCYNSCYNNVFLTLKDYKLNLLFFVHTDIF